MYVNLKIKFKGVSIEFKLHEVVYLALHVVNSIQEKTVPLTMEEKPNHLPDNDHSAEINEEKWVKEVAAHIIPFSIGPVRDPTEWLGVARGLSSLNNQEHIAVNVNGTIISIRLADLYSSDFGVIESIARQLFETTFVDPWEEEDYKKVHEVMYEKLQEVYKMGRLDELEKQLRRNIECDFEKDMQELKYNEEEIKELRQQIATMDLTHDFIPTFLQRKKCIDTNRQFQQSNIGQIDAAKRLDVLKSITDAANRGNMNLLPRSDDAFLVPLNSFSPDKVSFVKAQEKINKGPSYQKFEQAFQNDLHYLSDVELAKLSRQLLSGTQVKSYPNYLPNLLVAWFICETSRNNLSMLSSLILLDFMQTQIKYYSDGYNFYEFRHILRNPRVGLRGVVIHDVYGRKFGPDEWGGMHPMACEGSYKASSPLQPKKNKTNNYATELLTIVRQKEGSLILHWLFCILQREFPEIKLEELKKGKKLPSQFNYDEVVTDATNASNPKLPCGLKIEKTNSVALNKKIREVKNKILKLKNSDTQGEEQAKILQELLPLQYKQELIQTILIPLLTQRLTTFESFESIRPSPNSWYSEDIIQRLLKATLADSAIIMSQTQLEHDSLLEDNLRNALFQAIISGKPILVPIPLHDNHWSAMIIKKSAPDYPSQVIYNDSLGNSLETELSAAIIVSIITAIDLNAEIIDLRLQQQTHCCDCGPLAVDNLIRLSRSSTQGLNDEQLKSLLFQPLTDSPNKLRQQQRDILGNMTERDLMQLCPSTQKSEIIPKLQSHPYGDRTLITNLWSIIPDQGFVNLVLHRLAVIEISLQSNKQHVQTYAKKFMIEFLKHYIAAYKKDPKDNNNDIIKILELQLAEVDRDLPCKFIDNRVKYLVTEFLAKQFLEDEPIYKDKLEHHRNDNLVDFYFLNIRGTAVLAQAQSKLQSSVCPSLPWIADVLRFIKSTPNGYILLKDYYTLYAGLGCVEQAVTKGCVRLNNTFIEVLSNFNNWLDESKNKNYLRVVFKLFIAQMDELNMQNTVFYGICCDQVKSFESPDPQNFDIPFIFLIDLKCFEMFYILKNVLIQANEEDKKSKAQTEKKSSCEQRFFQAASSKEKIPDNNAGSKASLSPC